MYVEDLLLAINNQLSEFYDRQHLFDGLLDSEWHRNFIHNVSNHALVGHQLSSNQGKTILKIVAKVRKYIVAYGLATDMDIHNVLTHPEYRRPLYESLTVLREVRHLGSNYIGFRFKQNDLIAARIKKFGEPSTTKWLDSEIATSNIELISRPRFDWTLKIWIVPVFRHNMIDIIQLIKEYRFGVDAATASYLHFASQSFSKPSSFAMWEEFILGNVCDNPLLAAWITEIADGSVL